MKKILTVIILLCTILSTFSYVNSFSMVKGVTYSHSSTSPIVPENKPQANSLGLLSVTFPIGSYIIPMDDKQADVVKAFGFAHALLRNATMICRIIEPLPTSPPSNVTIKTNSYPSGTVYSGGPILINPAYQFRITPVKAAFPTVTMDQTTEAFTNGQVYVISVPTKILLIKSYPDWGVTQDLLINMKIPYDNITISALASNPSKLNEYDLAVDDCGGWDCHYLNTHVPTQVAAAMKIFVNNTGELIFTDRAQADMADVFPGYINISEDIDCFHNWNMHGVPDFPGQYYGRSYVSLYTMGVGLVLSGVNKAMHPTILVDTPNYDPNGSNYYAIAACYFYYGTGINKGILEAFSYHPGEQTISNTHDPESYKLASFLYGNKFIHRAAPIETGISRFSQVTPSTIAKNGTAKLPGGDIAKVKICLQPWGDKILAVNLAHVNYELMPYISSIPGTFKNDLGATLNPNYQVVYANGSRLLAWNVSAIPMGQWWNVSFSITSYLAGSTVYVNCGDESNLSYINAVAVYHLFQLTPVSLTVIDYSTIDELMMQTVFISFILVLATVVIIKIKRKT